MLVCRSGCHVMTTCRLAVACMGCCLSVAAGCLAGGSRQCNASLDFHSLAMG